MVRSLVGSEICIGDSSCPFALTSLLVCVPLNVCVVSCICSVIHGCVTFEGSRSFTNLEM